MRPLLTKLGVSLAGGFGLFVVGYLCGGASREASSSLEPQALRRAPTELLHLQLQAQQAQGGHDYFLRSEELDRLERLVAEAAGWKAVGTLTLETLPERQKSFKTLVDLTSEVIDEARLSLTKDRYAAAREALEAVHRSTVSAGARLERLLFTAVGGRPVGGAAAASAAETAGRAADPAASAGGAGAAGQQAAAAASAAAAGGQQLRQQQQQQPAPGGEELVVRVEEKPFGIHIRKGSTEVGEVFSGFPAERLGVRPGCEVLEVAGQAVLPGTWIELFQGAKLPFDLRLRCAPKKGRVSDAGPLTKQDPKHFHVWVREKPYGMDIQVNEVPRVVEVLPGFPAEREGVRTGFVLTAVNSRPVDANTWFEAFDQTPVPFVMTFDTTVPLPKRGVGAADGGAGAAAVGAPAGSKKADPSPPPMPDAYFSDFHCEVTKVPFGMQVYENDYFPVVHGVVASRPADQQGIRPGDVLVEVAGRPVTSSTWFAAFQQAAPPFGLRFRRPRPRGAAAAAVAAVVEGAGVGGGAGAAAAAAPPR